MSRECFVLSAANITYYPGVEVHPRYPLSNLLRLTRSDFSLYGAKELIDHVRLKPSAVYCSLPGWQLPKILALGSCQLRLVVLGNIFMIIQATTMVRTIELKTFERLRKAISRGGLEWADLISTPGQLFVADTKNIDRHFSSRMNDFLNDRLDHTQLDIGSIINKTRVNIISRMRDSGGPMQYKLQTAIKLNEYCRVSAVPREGTGIQLDFSNSGTALMEGDTYRYDLSAAAEHAGLLTAISIAIEKLLNREADRNERELKQIVNLKENGITERAHHSLVERRDEIMKLISPTMDIWNRLVIPEMNFKTKPLDDILRNIELSISRLAKCELILRDMMTPTLTEK